MSLQEQYIFWRLTNYFLIEEGYRLIHLHEKKQELWLDNPAQKKRPVIRIQMKELSWSNVLERDIEQVMRVCEDLRKQMGRLKLPLINIYITPFEPVGDTSKWFDQLLKSENEKISLDNILIDKENASVQLRALEAELDVPQETFQIPDHLDEAAITTERSLVINHITAKVSEEQVQARKEKPYVTYILLAIQIAVFLIMTFTGGTSNSTYNLVRWGAKFNPLIYAGEWWRFITPMFIHIGLLHLLMNSVVLYIIGPMAEKLYGKWRYALIYVLSGITGVVASFVFNVNIAAGASTAIFGIFGALLYLVVLKPHIYARSLGISIAGLVVVNLVVDIFSQGIDLAGHVGGLVGGFLIAGALSMPKQYFHWRRVLYGASAVLLTAFFLWFGFNKGQQPYDPENANAVAGAFIQKEDFQTAQKILDQLRISGSADDVTYTNLAIIALTDAKVQEGQYYAREAIEQESFNPHAHFLLARSYEIQGNLELALKEASIAVSQQDTEPYVQYKKYLEDKIKTRQEV
ncbi:rhomboid family intramembrane serine protease [Listeria weihenstephanensis]|uniref:Rhomboid family intramembrane serine protease n=1 Tax=Listeria weihenstephanensis TaxID=1006155 RepID=A0A841Z4C5_9LIST|nr:rhomboid family intramembrane serine protease [Listeria weihenstephanensis]MBC1500105.1 rhomboid family intramembrane serine protease [Listeria weihenstephanensis]